MLRAQATRAQAGEGGEWRGGGVGEEGMRQRTRARELAGTTLDLELDHAIARHARTAEARVVYYTGTRERRHARQHTTAEQGGLLPFDSQQEDPFVPTDVRVSRFGERDAIALRQHLFQHRVHPQRVLHHGQHTLSTLQERAE